MEFPLESQDWAAAGKAEARAQNKRKYAAFMTCTMLRRPGKPIDYKNYTPPGGPLGGSRPPVAWGAAAVLNA
jgi:hypothetical protein